MAIIKKLVIVSLIIMLLSIIAFGQTEKTAIDLTAGQEEIDSAANLVRLDRMLQNGKPTLAYFYYSVACSCTAVQCSLAAEAIDRTEELESDNANLNFISIDAFYETEAESLYKCQIVPLIVGFNAEGEEIDRVDWDVNRDSIQMILDKIKK